MKKLESKEVNSVVAYIGGSGGYLGDFSYATHSNFYPNYCGLEIDPNQYGGTTRQRFITILTNATPIDQAKILLGVLEKYPLHYFEQLFDEEIITKFEFRNKNDLHGKINKWIVKLMGKDLVEVGDLVHDFEFVKEVLSQAETLISQHSCSSAVDRAHTALHAYFKEICNKAGIEVLGKNPKIQDMWSKIKSEHPDFNIDVKEFHKPINQIVTTVGKTLENVNEIRNDKSFSHPNEEIIEENEAKLVINLSRVILQYIDSKIASSK